MNFLKISDIKAKEKTGKKWLQWFRILDRFDVKRNGHAAAARFVSEQHRVSPWWSQTIVVRYEKERGLRSKKSVRFRMPADFRKALDANAKAAQSFDRLPPSHKNEYLEAIAEAKKPETRERRIRGAIEQLCKYM